MKQVLQARNSAAAVVRDVPRPPCPPGNVLVGTAYSVISSGTERNRIALSQKSLMGKARERPDLVREVIDRARREGLATTHELVKRKLQEETPVGYSCAGHVLEVGERVRGIRSGDRVACAGAGHANHAEIVSVPGNLCAVVPGDVPLREAAFTTIAAIALHGIRLADARLGEQVAVIGCGLVGQIALRLLGCAGIETYAVELDQGRLGDALRSGADHAFAPADAAGGVAALTGGAGVDAVLVSAAASSSEPLQLATELARDRGAVVLVGAVPVEIPRNALYEKELSFRVSRSYGPGRYDHEYEERGLDYPIGYVRWTEQRNMQAVLDLLARGSLRLDDLVEDEFPVAAAAQAYAKLAGQSLRGALVLSYPQPQSADRPGALTVPVAAESPIPDAAAESSGPSVAAESPGPGAAAESRSSGLEQPRFGLIGPGNFALRTVVPALIAAGAKPEVVAGGSGPSAEAATRTHGFAHLAPDPQALIANDAVEIIAVCTRHDSHARLTIDSLAAGKHVFCEKPLALTQEDLGEVLRAAAASRGLLAVGFNRRFAPLLRDAREFLARPGQRMTISYRVAAGELAPEHWTHDLNAGGGRALGEGCHFVDCLAYLAASPIASVHAAGYSSSGLALQAWDNLVITLGFADGSLGVVTYVADGSGRLPKERLEAFSGARTAILDDYRELTTYDGRSKRTTASRTQDKGHRAEMEAFVAGVRSGNAPVPLAEIANVSLATLAIVESLRTGATIALEAGSPTRAPATIATA